ncbi:MAG: regulatory protein RecX [Dehalococcoidia bacterium]|nr:regulatory protein RecX [Dehalococcoidia bacterium]
MLDQEFQEALDAALGYLGPRQRSAWEVRQRLRRRSLDPDLIERIITWLVERRFIDDDAFAGFWVEGRESFKPRGKRLLRQELRLRGVSPEIVDPLLESLDEQDSAMRAARKKAQGLAGADYRTFASRLGGFLQRRGFSYDIIKTVTRCLWSEVAPGPASAEEAEDIDQNQG